MKHELVDYLEVCTEAINGDRARRISVQAAIEVERQELIALTWKALWRAVHKLLPEVLHPHVYVELNPMQKEMPRDGEIFRLDIPQCAPIRFDMTGADGDWELHQDEMERGFIVPYPKLSEHHREGWRVDWEWHGSYIYFTNDLRLAVGEARRRSTLYFRMLADVHQAQERKLKRAECLQAIQQDEEDEQEEE